MKKFNFDNINDVLSRIPAHIKAQRLSVLLPVYNESAFIAQNIRFLVNILRSWEWNFEIVASNDGSKDISWEEICAIQQEIPELIGVHSPRNFGKGRALASAFEASTGAYVLFLDSDLELPAEHIPYFFLKMIDSQADVIIGSKKDPQSDLFYPASRRLLSNLYFLGVKILFGLPVQDTQTGIKLFKRSVLESSLPYLLVKRFAFDIELLVLCHSQGAKIIPHPVVVRYVRDGIGRMGIQTMLHMFKDTLAVFWRLRTRLWKNVSQPRHPLTCATISLGQTHTHMGTNFVIYDRSSLEILMPKLEVFDVIIFLSEGDELAPFMQTTLERVFSNATIDVVVPLVYSASEQGAVACHYYVQANLFFPVGSYARFRPVRQHQSKNSFPLITCALRKQTLKDILVQDKELPLEGLRVSRAWMSPFFFIHVQLDERRWKSILNSEHSLDEYKKYAQAFVSMLTYLFLGSMLMLVFQGKNAVSLFVFCFSGVLFLLLELCLFLWYLFSLGLRRGVPYYFSFCKARILKLLRKI